MSMWEIFVILICLALNALIAATEFAFIAVSKSHLKKLSGEGHSAAERVLKLRENPERALSVMQLGITFIGVVAAAVGGAQFGNSISSWLIHSFGFGPTISHFLAILIFVVPYTYINVVFSELLPKSLALRNPKKIIFHMDRWLIFLSKVLAPIVFLLEKSTRVSADFLSCWIKKEEPAPEDVQVGALLRPYMVRLAGIEKKRIGDVMVPWEAVDTISEKASIGEVKEMILRTGHTRLPVIDGNEPMGLLLSKKFMIFFEKGDPNWQSLLKPLIKLADSDSLVHGLKAMQSEHSHLSVVYSQNQPVGIVTIEDILEEVVGEIYDEDDINSMNQV